MEKQINEAFENLKMSDECDERIRTSFNHPTPHRIHFGAIAVAACLLMVIFVFTNSTAVAALETVGEHISEVVASLFHPDAVVEEQHVFEGGNYVSEKGVDAEGNRYVTSQYNTGSVSSWLEAAEDGLYFIGDGKRIEISGLISNETPFTYIFTDSEDIRHYIAVGGVYGIGENALDTVGWCEWTQKAPYAPSSWIGGYATRKYNNRTGENYQWYVVAKEILGIPFP